MSYNNYSKYNQYKTCCKPIGTTGATGPADRRYNLEFYGICKCDRTCYLYRCVRTTSYIT